MDAPLHLKGRSHERLQVTEEYRLNWKGGGGDAWVEVWNHGEGGKSPSGKHSSERFRTWTRTIALLKGRSHECLQVTEDYRPN
ncbi:hypothetical protein CEXT_455661 [Caerostris extrusa]|uniref:Uncharacterized protein n=1 Tax=Caerostris extrusa TaxID=172846 RepID=A0AAV4NCL9_CAEEX|nr:hypothetical protein CEXT_455661 [Caerostris extrusa]